MHCYLVKYEVKGNVYHIQGCEHFVYASSKKEALNLVIEHCEKAVYGNDNRLRLTKVNDIRRIY